MITDIGHIATQIRKFRINTFHISITEYRMYII